MIRSVLAAATMFALVAPAAAEVPAFPTNFRTQDVQTDGATIHVRVGGQGPAVVLLHGFGDTGDMWAPMAADLARDHTVVVPDLRGMGLSSHPEGGYDKRTQAADIRSVLTSSTSTAPRSSATTSAPWSRMPMRSVIPTRPRSSW
jgi:alpha-beta hydrolase superfamily lysophospholipase